MREHGQVTSRSGHRWLAGRVAAALVAALGASGAALAAAGPAAAAGCAQMTLAYDPSSPTLLALRPASVRIAYGGCVQFTNRTGATATFTVTPSYSQQVAAGATTSRAQAYVGNRSGRHDVTGTSGPGSAAGSISVGRRPAPSPSASSRPPSSPHPSRSPGGSPTPTPARRSPSPQRSTPAPATSATSSPVGSATPARHRRPSPAPSATPSVLAGAPGGPPRPSLPRAGRLQPASGRGVGLPAALAALTIVATAAGFVRVLLAEPVAVDDPPIVGGRS